MEEKGVSKKESGQGGDNVIRKESGREGRRRVDGEGGQRRMDGRWGWVGELEGDIDGFINRHH